MLRWPHRYAGWLPTVVNNIFENTLSTPIVVSYDVTANYPDNTFINALTMASGLINNFDWENNYVPGEYHDWSCRRRRHG